MLASTNYLNHSIDFGMYDKHWIDNHSIRIPWLNYLTSQSIPEEIDCPKRQHTDSGCSSPSSEDSYVVLEFKKPRSIIKDVELNFEDEHHVEYDQFTEPILTPVKENAVEYSFEFEYATVKDSSAQQYHNRQISLENHPLKSSPKSIEQTTTVTPDTQQLSLPSIFRLIKKCCRINKSEYDLVTNEMKSDEPSLLRMKYLDGRPTLIDLNAIESFQKSQTHRKRILNCLQTSPNPPLTNQSKSWQHKTIFELINERKTKRNRS